MIAISLGDPAGISSEILNKSINKISEAKIFGHESLCPDSLPKSCVWENIEGQAVKVGQPSEESGRQAFRAFEAAALSVSAGETSALVTLPLAKEYVALSVKGFHGHTDVLEDFWGGQSLMTLLGGSLRVALVTDHEAIRDLPALITCERLLSKARTLRQDIKRYFTGGLEPQLNLLALNPHAGENGLMGDEEKILLEALKILKAEGGDWQGPWPADAFFARQSYGDAVLALYHDQGLIPVKMLAQNQGVNITLGLNHLRTSPDHGTAFDIAGKNQADPGAFLAAFDLARELSTQKI
jgi:4-hydroxythreonine-4-phosphate dehydrogenase